LWCWTGEIWCTKQTGKETYKPQDNLKTTSRQKPDAPEPQIHSSRPQTYAGALREVDFMVADVKGKLPVGSHLRALRNVINLEALNP
jgi:hypothetical protein